MLQTVIVSNNDMLTDFRDEGDSMLQNGVWSQRLGKPDTDSTEEDDSTKNNLQKSPLDKKRGIFCINKRYALILYYAITNDSFSDENDAFVINKTMKYNLIAADAGSTKTEWALLPREKSRRSDS